MFLYKFDGLFEVLDTSFLCAVVCGGYEFVDCEFVLVEEGVDMFLVEDAGTLGLW